MNAALGRQDENKEGRLKELKMAHCLCETGKRSDDKKRV